MVEIKIACNFKTWSISFKYIETPNHSYHVSQWHKIRPNDSRKSGFFLLSTYAMLDYCAFYYYYLQLSIVHKQICRCEHIIKSQILTLLFFQSYSKSDIRIEIQTFGPLQKLYKTFINSGIFTCTSFLWTMVIICQNLTFKVYLKIYTK